MLRIHQALQAGGYPNASKLAREVEVSTKTIHRDIEFMRDRLKLPIAYDNARWGYYYTEEVTSFPTLQITEGEMFAMLVAEKALQQYRGTTFEAPLVSASDSHVGRDSSARGTVQEGRCHDRAYPGVEEGLAQRARIRHAHAHLLHQPRRQNAPAEPAGKARPTIETTVRSSPAGSPA